MIDPVTKLWQPSPTWRQSQPAQQQLTQGRHGFFWPDCGCCGVEGCAACPSTVYQWQITISGVTNSGCANCAADYNGTFILTQSGPSSCTWLSAEQSTCLCGGGAGLGVRWSLGHSFGGVWILRAWGDRLGSGVRIAAWSSVGSNINPTTCLNGSTVSLTSICTLSGNTCNNWPATVNFTPA